MAYISLTYEYADGTKIHARAQSDLADTDLDTFRELTKQAVVGLQCLSDRDDDDDD